MANIPTLHRPIFDGLATGEAKFEAAMAEYHNLKDVDQDGMDFSNKTAMWIAYERYIESQREDRLFQDNLAQHFMEPYGKRLSDSMSLGLAYGVFDPPGEDIGFGLEGHVMYTAARTKLINDHVTHWLNKDTSLERKRRQVLNLGAGFDTRVYWLESLQKACLYWEVDTASVMNHKQKILDDLKCNGALPSELCERKPVIMDLSNESIADLPSKHQYQAAIPTCWILEGLIMYLKRPDVEQLLDNISNLSASGSFLILNFSNNVPGGPSADEIDEHLEGKGWRKIERLMVGDEGFNFDRYPTGKSSNKIVGISSYEKL